MSNPRVLHIASHNINIGDGAIVAGIRKYLDRVAEETIIYENVDIVDFDPGFGNLSLRDIDFSQYRLILVGGGGTIDGKPSRTKSGMAFPMSGDELRHLNTPIAYVALGYNLFPGEKLHCRTQLVDVLTASAERGIPFSVRNDGSLERLREQVGAVADHVWEVPDPGFFIKADKEHIVPQMTDQYPKVIIQLAGDNLARRFGIERRTMWHRLTKRFPSQPFDHFLDAMGRLVVWLVRNYDAEVILAPHITRDLTVTGEILRRLPTRIGRKRTRVLGIAHPHFAPQFFAAYAKADLVIGMRGHSVICSVGLRVPCIAVSTHDKVCGFMRKCGLEHWSIHFSPTFEEEIRSLCQGLFESPDEYFAVRDAGTEGFEQQFTSFIKRCWDVST